MSGWLLRSMANGSQYVAASHLSDDRVRAHMHICHCETACCRPRQQKTKFGSSQAKNRWLRLKYFSAGVDLCYSDGLLAAVILDLFPFSVLSTPRMTGFPAYSIFGPTQLKSY